MIDEIFDRQYQAGRQELNDGLDRLFGKIGRELGKSLGALHRIEWNTPWATSRKVNRKGARLA